MLGLGLIQPNCLLSATLFRLAQSPAYMVGTPLSQEEIRSFDFMIGPAGKELPPGHETATEGAAVFAKRAPPRPIRRDVPQQGGR
jgi:hypothetical protein